MSWSIGALGEPSAVAAKLAIDFGKIKCAEPEESIKNHIASAVALALGAYPPGVAVNVQANGSQYAPDSKKPEEVFNFFSAKVESLGQLIK